MTEQDVKDIIDDRLARLIRIEEKLDRLLKVAETQTRIDKCIADLLVNHGLMDDV